MKRKKIKKVATIGMTAVMALLVATPVMALPSSTVVVGAKAYSLDYFFDTTLPESITDAISDGGDLYYEAGAGFLDAWTGSAMSQSAKDALTNIEYLNHDGTIEVYSDFDDTDPIPGALTVESVSAVNKTLTVTFTNAVTEAPKAADFVVKQDDVVLTLADTDITVVDGKVAIQVPEVVATTLAQDVVYSVSYKSGDAETFTLNVPAAEDQTYAELKVAIELKIADYTALADGDLTTQELVDAAKASAELIDLTGLNDEDKAAAQATVDAATAKVTAAQEVITKAANDALVAAAITAVNSATAETMQAVLETNAQVLTIDLVDYNTLAASNKAAVATAVLNGKAVQEGASYLDVASIKAAFDNSVLVQKGLYATEVVTKSINDYTAVTPADAATDDAAIRAILESKATELGLDLTDYNILSDVAKTAVASYVLAQRPVAPGYVNAVAVKVEFDAQVAIEIASYNGALVLVNAPAVTADMKLALEVPSTMRALGIDTSKYLGLGASYKTAVAAKVLALRPLDLTTTGDLLDTKYTAPAQIMTVYDAEVLIQALKQVNDATTLTDTQTAIVDNAAALGLDVTVYNSLGPVFKTNVTTAILNAKAIQPSGKYASAATLKIAFNNAVATQGPQAVQAGLDALNAVTIAGTEATVAEQGAMQAAIEANALVLGLSIQPASVGVVASDYNSLSGEGKLVVAKAVLEGKGTGYASNDAVKTKFDTVVATQKAAEGAAALSVAISAVNNATNVNQMDVAINLPALGLAIATNSDGSASDYSALSNGVGGYKEAVAQKIIVDRAIQPNQQYANADAINVEFNQAVAYYKQVQAGVGMTATIAAVNGAANVVAMEGIIEDPSNAATLGLAIGSAISPTDYYNLRANFQTSVAKAVFDGKTTAFYTSGASIKSVFETAVTAQKAAQAAEDASILAVNTVAMALNVPTDSEGAAMQTVLVANAQVLNLNVIAASDFDALSTGAKLSVAKAVLVARYAAVDHKFATAPAIQNAFTVNVDIAKLAQSAAVADIAGANALNMQQLLEARATILSLDLTDYNTFTLGQKGQIAQSVIDGQVAVPGGVYTNAATIKTVFSNAVANVKASNETQVTGVAAVNSATAQTIQTVLVTNASVLGIDVSSTSNYSKLATDADRASMAAAFLNSRPTNGFASTASVQTAFNNAVALKMVNSATTVSAMTTALTNLSAELGINFTGLPPAAQPTTATAVLNGKAVQAGGAYADVAAIKVVYNNAAFADSIAPELMSFALEGIVVDLTVATPTIDLSAKSDADVINFVTFNVKDNNVGGVLGVRDVIKVTFSGITKTYSDVVADNTPGGALNTVSLDDLIGNLDSGVPGVSMTTLKALATATNSSTLSLAVDLSDVAGNHTTGTLLIKVK